ncbi:hypothetical protein C7S14_2857 [Burkholderia cepacia]|nr:hypothetical protein C7S14_2857 [Burkholderia cepacia]
MAVYFITGIIRHSRLLIIARTGNNAFRIRFIATSAIDSFPSV